MWQIWVVATWLVSCLLEVGKEAEVNTLVQVSLCFPKSASEGQVPGSRIAESEQMYILDFD